MPAVGGSLSDAGTVVVRGVDTHVAGDFTQAADGVLSVSLGSELKVAGSASLAGNFNVLGADRSYVATKHQDVLTVGAVGGTFGALTTSPGVFLKSTLEYAPTSVWLDTTSLDIAAAALAEHRGAVRNHPGQVGERGLSGARLQ